MKFDLQEHGFTVGKLQGNNLGLSEVIKKKEEEIEMIKTEIKKLIVKVCIMSLILESTEYAYI